MGNVQREIGVVWFSCPLPMCTLKVLALNFTKKRTLICRKTKKNFFNEKETRLGRMVCSRMTLQPPYKFPAYSQRTKPLLLSTGISQHQENAHKCLLTCFCKFLLSLWLLLDLLFVLQCLSSNRTLLWIPAPDR